MESCPEKPRYVLIGCPGEHDTIVAKSLLKKANIDFFFVKESEEDTSPYRVNMSPAIRLVEAPGIPIADGIDEIKSWLQAS